MSQSEAVNEMNLCGRIGVRLFLLNTLCWFSPWELMKTDYKLESQVYKDTELWLFSNANKAGQRIIGKDYQAPQRRCIKNGNNDLPFWNPTLPQTCMDLRWRYTKNNR